jgi:hypothetical protein
MGGKKTIRIQNDPEMKGKYGLRLEKTLYIKIFFVFSNSTQKSSSNFFGMKLHINIFCAVFL